MEDFRYALKKVQRIDIEMTYEEVSHTSSPCVCTNSRRSHL
jgi:hypothetical protein